jgi:hypothetical protein
MPSQHSHFSLVQHHHHLHNLHLLSVPNPHAINSYSLGLKLSSEVSNTPIYHAFTKFVLSLSHNSTNWLFQYGDCWGKQEELEEDYETRIPCMPFTKSVSTLSSQLRFR